MAKSDEKRGVADVLAGKPGKNRPDFGFFETLPSKKRQEEIAERRADYDIGVAKAKNQKK